MCLCEHAFGTFQSADGFSVKWQRTYNEQPHKETTFVVETHSDQLIVDLLFRSMLFSFSFVVFALTYFPIYFFVRTSTNILTSTPIFVACLQFLCSSHLVPSCSSYCLSLSFICNHIRERRSHGSFCLFAFEIVCMCVDNFAAFMLQSVGNIEKFQFGNHSIAKRNAWHSEDALPPAPPSVP